MTALTRVRPFPGLREAVVGVALVAALLAGASMASGLGLALVVALCYGPLAFINLPVAIAVWIPLVFLVNIHALDVGPTLAGMLLVFAWFVGFLDRASPAHALVQRHRGKLALLGLLLLWLTLSAGWSRESALGGQVFFAWWTAGLVFLVLVTTIVEASHVRLLLGAYVVGAVAAVAVGLFASSITEAGSALDAATANDARLGGGSGDPNLLAAGIVPAVVVAAGLAVTTRRSWVRWVIPLAIALLVVGLAATESRGGLVGAVAAVLAGLVFFRRRVYLVVLVAFVVGVGAIWFSVNPSGFERITTFDASGAGRTELWDVAWGMMGDHPIAGVGLENYETNAGDYALRLGPLEFVENIVEDPHVAHNAYLQIGAELGLVGLALFVAVVFATLRSAWRAARLWDQAQQAELGTLARAVLVAAISTLAASFFLSNGFDRRLWILLALGPVMEALASAPPTRRS